MSVQQPQSDRQPRQDHWVGLERSRLCIDCEVIFEGAACARCGGRNAEPVARWLDPKAPSAARDAGSEATPDVGAERPQRRSIWLLAGFVIGLLAGRASIRPRP